MNVKYVIQICGQSLSRQTTKPSDSNLTPPLKYNVMPIARIKEIPKPAILLFILNLRATPPLLHHPPVAIDFPDLRPPLVALLVCHINFLAVFVVDGEEALAGRRVLLVGAWVGWGVSKNRGRSTAMG
jgi:hypothetical protein